MIAPKLEYPAYFEGGLVGVRVKEAIKPREAFIKIPYKCLMTCEGAFKHPVLGQVLKENPEVFDEEEGRADWEQLTLCLYLIYEWQLGDESFWKPYIDLMPEVDFFCHWGEHNIYLV